MSCRRPCHGRHASPGHPLVALVTNQEDLEERQCGPLRRRRGCDGQGRPLESADQQLAAAHSRRGSRLQQRHDLHPPGQIWCGTCSHPPFDDPAHLTDATKLAQGMVPAGPLVHHPGIDEPPVWLWHGRSRLAADVSTYGPDSPSVPRSVRWPSSTRGLFSGPACRSPEAARPWQPTRSGLAASYCC
jgi:hypothetical protein